MKLSVIITAHNQAESVNRILKRIESVPVGVDIIVVDDDSDDDEQYKIMQAVSDFHARSGAGRYMRTECRSGCGGARNFGVDHCNSRWLWFVDGDDVLAPGALERVVYAIDRAKTPIIAIGYEIRKADGGVSAVIPSAEMKPWEWSVTAWSKIIRTNIYHEFAASFVEDNDWWFRECLESQTMDVLPEVCYEYNQQTPGSVTEIFERIWQNSKADGPLPLNKLIAAMGPKAWVISAMLKMMGRLVDVRCEAEKRNVPEGLRNAIDFAIKYFTRAIVRE